MAYNGAWLDRMQIPQDKSGVSLRQMMSDRTEAHLHEMMDQAAAHAQHQPADLEGKMGAFYKSFMDEARVEQLGAKPIAVELDQVRAATTATIWRPFRDGVVRTTRELWLASPSAPI